MPDPGPPPSPPTPSEPGLGGPLERSELQLRGELLFWLGICLMLWGLAAMARGLAWMVDGAVGWFLLAELIGSLLTGTGVTLAVRGKRARAADVEQVQALDRRAPILYLRGFQDDLLSEAERRIPEAWTAPLALWERTSEEALVHQFRHLGPVIALGQPQERVPTGGAARHYLRDSGSQAEMAALGAGEWPAWKLWVQAQLGRAQLAIVNWHPTPSESLRWELATALAVLGPHRVLIWFPQPQDWAAFCADPRVSLPRPPASADVLLLGFAEDGQPVVHQTCTGRLA
jgi:hypothetical protein